MGIFISSEKLRRLQERVDELETKIKTLDMEWSSTYDKFRAILARIAKREERARADVAESDSSAGSQEPLGQAAPPFQTIDPVSARILARRNRLSQRNQ